MSDSDLADEVRRLRAELDEVKQLLRNSGRGLSRSAGPAFAAIDADDGTVRSDSESDSESDSDAGSVSRRHALHTAGVIVAGALAGGIATVATAGPAAATTNYFVGEPAINAANYSSGRGGDAISATSTNGYGVYGYGGISGGSFQGNWGVILNGTDAHIIMNPSGTPPPSSSTIQYAGSIKLDSNSVLWLCIADGTPGVWQQIGGLGVAGAYHAVTPSRVYDSRRPTYPLNGVLSSGQNRTISVANSYHTGTGVLVTSNFVPAGATAVFANVGVVNTVGEGWLAVNPGGVTAVSASTINWSAAGQILANGVALTLNDSRQLTAVNRSPGSTDFFIDITGYWL
ncbi:unannotated protein [freshwater metagenome]|uniref:Unannotated protein n=1 Tax=freshwater metagenome TaxID=449393 RepID=A0A6J7JN40_9ZZZZ|nr:hypothetical protein [Actinomycetota bacterium]